MVVKDYNSELKTIELPRLLILDPLLGLHLVLFRVFLLDHLHLILLKLLFLGILLLGLYLVLFRVFLLDHLHLVILVLPLELQERITLKI
jgi:hypothetical protein